MTKKDYELIASAMYNARVSILGGELSPETSYEELLLKGWETSVRNLSMQLKMVNPRFDADKFLQVCTHHQY